MDLTSNIESLSVADVPTLSKAAFVLSSKTVIRSQISCLNADREFKGILSTNKVALHSTRLCNLSSSENTRLIFFTLFD